ncbi:MAG TPA: PLP-dependent aminotransferase family protein [Gemmatimonadetes bacterium]|nr:PLP-dependent aminotransferase family protein [Gemmatimonadota bacterium]
METSDAIAQDVSSGVLAEGAKLPTHRELAGRLGVTVGTVTRGYAEAERPGLTVAEVGRGTYVRSRREAEDFGWWDAAREGASKGVVDMSLVYPWVPPDGEEGRLLAHWIGRMGLDVTPDQVIATNGAQRAMTVCLASLLRPGDTLMTAELTYPGLKAVSRMLELRVRGVAMDDEGIIPEALDAHCSESPAHALYVVPTIQNPTGATMSEERRREIAGVARRHGLIILEDEIHVVRHPDRSLRAGARRRAHPFGRAFKPVDGRAAHDGGRDAMDHGRHGETACEAEARGARGSPRHRTGRVRRALRVSDPAPLAPSLGAATRTGPEGRMRGAGEAARSPGRRGRSVRGGAGRAARGAGIDRRRVAPRGASPQVGDLGRGLRGMLGPVRRDPLGARIQANVPNASAAPFPNAGSARLYLRR